MSSTLTAKFETRRDADMTVERLVQEFKVERTDVFVTTEGRDNSAGLEPDGSENEAGSPSREDRDDAALAGSIVVSVDVQDDELAGRIRAAFAEFGGSPEEESA